MSEIAHPAHTDSLIFPMARTVTDLQRFVWFLPIKVQVWKGERYANSQGGAVRAGSRGRPDCLIRDAAKPKSQLTLDLSAC
jgi:hypothetical protein